MKALSSLSEGRVATNWRPSVTALPTGACCRYWHSGSPAACLCRSLTRRFRRRLRLPVCSSAAIGTLALVGTPYAFKFLWSPLIDRLPPPLGWGGDVAGE